MKKFSIVLVLLLAVSLTFAFAKGKPAFVTGEIVVKFALGADKAGIAKRFEMAKVADSHKKGVFTVFRHGNPDVILDKLNATSGVIYAEKNGIAYASMVPNDPLYDGYQWHLTRIGCESAWNITSGSSSVIVAVNDTGVKQSLEDLANTNFVPGYNFIRNKVDATDDHGHGSHVAGTIAQSTNNNLGVAGIAYSTSIMPVKVLDRRGSGSYTAIANGIYFATDNGADIINMSLGGPSSSSTMEDAVNYAWNNGVVVICAAGNESCADCSYPAVYTNAISVSATNYLDQLAGYSNYGSTIDICAPGGDGNDFNGDGYIDGVLQNTFSRNNEGYYFMYGTSMACPHVAGVAALVKAVDPSLTNAQIRSILESTAEDLGASGWDQYFGHGMVDALAAVQAAQ